MLELAQDISITVCVHCVGSVLREPAILSTAVFRFHLYKYSVISGSSLFLLLAQKLRFTFLLPPFLPLPLFIQRSICQDPLNNLLCIDICISMFRHPSIQAHLFGRSIWIYFWDRCRPMVYGFQWPIGNIIQVGCG